jgi:hypothetical protein
MFAVELQPTAYQVEAAEAPAAGYIFGTVRDTGSVPRFVVVSWSGARGDRYPIDSPQEWLAQLVNAGTTPEAARAFFLANGVVDVDAITVDPKKLPRRVRDFWKKARDLSATPFAVQIDTFLRAKEKAQERLDLANRARQKDLAGRIARGELTGALANGGLRNMGIQLYHWDNESLVAYAEPRTMNEAIDLCVLDYYAQPDIVKCETCKKLFRRLKFNQLFCSPRCKNLAHVRKYRAARRELHSTETQ